MGVLVGSGVCGRRAEGAVMGWMGGRASLGFMASKQGACGLSMALRLHGILVRGRGPRMDSAM